MSIRSITVITAWYGNDKSNETEVFVAEMSNGDIWYVAEGGRNVNLAPNELEDGCWLEEIRDLEMFTADEPVESVAQFEDELERKGV